MEGIEMRFLFSVFVLLVCSGLALVDSAEASQSLEYKIHQHYISTRAMGMGNAFTAVADDYSLWNIKFTSTLSTRAI
jgi:hypothetical protein